MSQSIRRASRAAAVVRLATTVPVLVVAATCVRDQTTAPALRAPPSVAVHGTYTTLGTYSIPIPGDNLNGAGVPAANTGIFVPAGTYYRVRVDGTVTTTLNPAYLALGGTAGFASWTGTWGPGGTGNAAELQVLLKYRITSSGAVGPIPFLNLQMGASAPDSARTDVQYTSTHIEIQAGRNVIACAIGTSQGNAGCYLLTASQTVTVEQVTDVAHVVANPVAVHPNTQVTFTASRDDGGNLIIYNWHWQPDAGQPGNATNLCGGSNPCQMNVAGSGTMLVYTNAGNPTAHVVVYQATNPDTSFRLVVDRSTAVIGDTVTFTPLYNGVPGPAARWRWVPSDTLHDVTACANGASPCRKAMIASGTMWAYTSTMAGQGDSASAPVAVRTPSLSVRASPDYAYGGDTVVFSVGSPDGTADVTSWTWIDDPIVLANRLGPVARLSGSYLKGRQSVRPSGVARVRSPAESPLFSVESNMSCAAHASTCVETVMASGVMHVRAIVRGVTVEDSVHVTIADLDNLPDPPPDIAQPDGNDGVSEPPTWCPTDPKIYLQSTVVRSRMKLLYDSTALEHLEHGSFVYVDSLTDALSNGPVIEGDSISVPGMNPPPPAACFSIHAHPDGKQYQLGPSGGDQFYSSKWHLAGFVITKSYVFYMDTAGRARAIARRAG